MRKKPDSAGMTIIVKRVTSLTVGLILLYGMYIVLHGHLSPGGGFAGGVIMALAFVNLTIAYGKETALKRLSRPVLSGLEGFGALLFLAIALVGFAGGAFFLNVAPKGHSFELFSAGFIPLSNIAICLKVGAGLFAIFLALVLLKPESEEER